MEEKERFEWRYNGKVLKHYILDTQTKEQLGYEEVSELLNQQDKHIKELEKELSKYKSYKTTDERIKDLESLYFDYKKENQQLKDQIKELQDYTENTANLIDKLTEDSVSVSDSKQLTISELKKVKNILRYYCDVKSRGCDIFNYLDNQIKELKGEE